MIDINAIPAERLALLDTLTLFHGAHGGNVRHCARELLYEVVTGKHFDMTPKGCSAMIGVLPAFNDGPWLDDAHRTRVMRPYLKKILLLDPEKDPERIFCLFDYIHRQVLPTICDSFKDLERAKKLRALEKIVDDKSLMRSIDLVRNVLFVFGSIRAFETMRTLQIRNTVDNAVSALFALCAVSDSYANILCNNPETWEKDVTYKLDLICSI